MLDGIFKMLSRSFVCGINDSILERFSVLECFSGLVFTASHFAFDQCPELCPRLLDRAQLG